MGKSCSGLGTNNATAVFLNGNDNFGLDVYATQAEILVAGQESEFYLTGPTAQGYNCFHVRRL